MLYASIFSFYNTERKLGQFESLALGLTDSDMLNSLSWPGQLDPATMQTGQIGRLCVQ
jgi:hypothetical protein